MPSHIFLGALLRDTNNKTFSARMQVKSGKDGLPRTIDCPGMTSHFVAFMPFTMQQQSDKAVIITFNSETRLHQFITNHNGKQHPTGETISVVPVESTMDEKGAQTPMFKGADIGTEFNGFGARRSFPRTNY